MTQMKLRTLLTLGLGAFVLAACGDDDGSTDTPEDMGVEADADVTPPDMPPMIQDMGPPRPTECTAEGMGSTLGQSCVRDLDCSDACFCNGIELCQAGTCVAGQQPCGRTDCSTGTCDEATRSCDESPDDSLCDDGVFCNGQETCDPEFGCRPGVPPFCGDGDICTIDFCDEDMTMCVHTVLDEDGDGEPSRSCGGNDCDDSNGGRFPGNTEICDNGIDDDCNARVDAEDATCAPPNDRCDAGTDGRGPLDITRTSDGTTVISTSTVAMTNDYDVSCTTSSTREDGPDAVFTFTLTETKDVSVEVQGIDNDAVLEIRPASSCTSETGNFGCSAPSTGLQPFVLARSLPAGDYAIIVSTERETAYDLAFTLAPPTTLDLSMDSCDTTMVDISAGGTFTGSFEGDLRYDGDELNDNYTPPCRSSSFNYAEAAFRLTIPAGELRDVLLQGYTFSSTGSGRQPYIYLTDDCDAPSPDITQCAEADSSGDPATLRLRNLPGGTYFVVLDADFSSDVNYSLDVQVMPASGSNPGDACVAGNPVDITSGTGTIDLATLEHTPDAGSFCRTNGSTATDAFFQFTLTSEQDVTVTTTSSPSVRHTAGLSDTCGSVPNDYNCLGATGGSGSKLYRRLPAGTYFVNVTTLETTGTISASIATAAPTPAPANNTCATAKTLTSGAVENISLPDYDSNGDYCGEVGWLDAYYTFTLAAQSSVTLRGENVRGVVLLDGSCTGTETCDSALRIEQTLPAGTYYVAVEADPFSVRSDARLFFTAFAL